MSARYDEAQLAEAGRKIFAGEADFIWAASTLEPLPPMQGMEIAFAGRSNVGKSSLLNRLLGEERTVVSDIPGTTRDAIDDHLEHGGRTITLVDTAGIKRRGQIAAGPVAEKYATVRSVAALDRADVALLVVDAERGLLAQDLHVAGSVIEAGKGLVIVLNKWDLVEKDGFTFDAAVDRIRRQAPFLDFARVLSISALTGLRATKVLDAAIAASDARQLRIPTGALNRLVAEAVARQEPAHSGSKRPKILFAAQAATPPPTNAVMPAVSAMVRARANHHERPEPRRPLRRWMSVPTPSSASTSRASSAERWRLRSRRCVPTPRRSSA